MTPRTQPVERLLHEHRVLVCVGAGGVGKTTVSAALGVAAARMGRRALVLTVDPARRLANALGLDAFEEHIQRIEPERFCGPNDVNPVALDVAMLDVKSTFDRVVERYTDNEESRQAILNNAFYQQASTALAGSQEYMAMQRLYEVVVDEPYEVIILDTPPSAHALDFLDAPRRMIDLFGSSAFRKLLNGFGGGIGASRLFRPGSLLMRGLGRFTSADMFNNLLGFFAALSKTFDGFVRGATDVLALLRSEQTAFVIVSAPDDGSTYEAMYLRQRLLDEEMNLGAWVLNRLRGDRLEPLQDREGLADRLQAAMQADARGDEPVDEDAPHSAAVEIADAALRVAEMAAEDATHAQKLSDKLAGRPLLVRVGRASVEPASLAELSRLAETLVADQSVGA